MNRYACQSLLSFVTQLLSKSNMEKSVLTYTEANVMSRNKPYLKINKNHFFTLRYKVIFNIDNKVISGSHGGKYKDDCLL
jgi:hypothetical protein